MLHGERPASPTAAVARPGARDGRGAGSRCRAQCEGKSLREKQQIGAHAVAEAKRQGTLDRLVAAYRRLVDDGVVPAGSTPANGVWATTAGVTVRTLQNHRTALQAALGTRGEIRSEDKRTLSSTLKNHNPFLFPTVPTQPESLPGGNGQSVRTTQHSDRSPVSPPLALLTIPSPARLLRPGESFAPSGAPIPTVPSWAAGLVLFSGAVVPPAPDLGSHQSFEAEEMLARAGFVRASAGEKFTLLPTTPHAPPAPAEGSAAAAPVARDPAAPGPVPGRRPVERTQRDLAPGGLAAPAATLRHRPPVRPAASPPGRRIVAGGVLDQTSPAEPPGLGSTGSSTTFDATTLFRTGSSDG
jgi:hypothetical protein